MLNPDTQTTWGTDPEAFFSKAGRIVGSEKLISDTGLKAGKFGKIVRDGVQFEMHPTPNVEPYTVAYNVGKLFVKLRALLAENKGVSINFDGLVEVSRRELDSLSEGSRVLGCMPSFNYYEDRPINVNPLTYRKRSSGGHIHVGLGTQRMLDLRYKLVPVMDIIVGGIAVLVDRDPGAAERRENYGRAGEHRFPDHGLEYRTTSNFWLRDPVLMDLTFGLANIAVSVFKSATERKPKPWQDLVKAVDLAKVRKAIDKNDFKQALTNFNKLIPFFEKHLPPHGFVFSKYSDTANRFIQFAKQIENDGIESLFPEKNIIDRWTGDHQTFSDYIR